MPFEPYKPDFSRNRHVPLFDERGPIKVSGTDAKEAVSTDTAWGVSEYFLHGIHSGQSVRFVYEYPNAYNDTPIRFSYSCQMRELDRVQVRADKGWYKLSLIRNYDDFRASEIKSVLNGQSVPANGISGEIGSIDPATFGVPSSVLIAAAKQDIPAAAASPTLQTVGQNLSQKLATRGVPAKEVERVGRVKLESARAAEAAAKAEANDLNNPYSSRFNQLFTETDWRQLNGAGYPIGAKGFTLMRTFSPPKGSVALGYDYGATMALVTPKGATKAEVAAASKSAMTVFANINYGRNNPLQRTDGGNFFTDSWDALKGGATSVVGVGSSAWDIWSGLVTPNR